MRILVPIEKINVLFSCHHCDHEVEVDLDSILMDGYPSCGKCIETRDISIEMDHNINAYVEI